MWQSINTAPKDGTNILLFIEDSVIEGSYDTDMEEWDCVRLPDHGCGCCSSANDEPIFWMPLPEGPYVQEGDVI